VPQRVSTHRNTVDFVTVGSGVDGLVPVPNRSYTALHTLHN
jgi:hypothetical protein